jgi:hypothetical protein
MVYGFAGLLWLPVEGISELRQQGAWRYPSVADVPTPSNASSPVPPPINI